MNDEPDVAPEPEPMHFTDVDWYFFVLLTYSSLICWLKMVMLDRALLSHSCRATRIHKIVSMPHMNRTLLSHSHRVTPHTQNTQPYGPSSLVPVDFEYDISVNYHLWYSEAAADIACWWWSFTWYYFTSIEMTTMNYASICAIYIPYLTLYLSSGY
jgi:hypothetical protein